MQGKQAKSGTKILLKLLLYYTTNNSQWLFGILLYTLSLVNLAPFAIYFENFTIIIIITGTITVTIAIIISLLV